MADKNLEPRSGGVRVKAGVLPGVREIRRPDFTKKAADIEKAEAERVLKQGEDTDAADAAAVKASLEAQEAGGEDAQLDESAITDEPLWYVAHTYSGYENKVKINIEKTIENRHLENQIFEVRVPMQEIVEVKGGARKNVAKKMFPGYVLVNMIMNDDTWYVVRNTRGVTGFVGPGSEPIPLSDEEFERMMSCQGTIHIDLEPGDSVRVKNGSIENAIYTVEEVMAEEHKVKVSIEILSRKTTTVYDVSEVERL